MRPEKRLCVFFFYSRIIRLKFSLFSFVCMRKNHYFDNKHTRWIGLACFRKLLLYRTLNFTTSNVNKVRMQKFHNGLTFFYVFFFFFFFFFLQIHKIAWEGRGKPLFLSSISPHLQTFRHLFVVLHMTTFYY